jgi:hypothetical protein
MPLQGHLGDRNDWDTILTVPREDWAAGILLYLRLEEQPLDLAPLADLLLDSRTLAVLDAAIDIADPAQPLRRQLHAAIEHLRDDDYVLAGPPLVTAVEGLWWEAAIEKGAIDKTTRRIVAGERAGKKATSAHDVFDAMPLNDRVKEKLDRYAFGGEANAFRHGQEGDWGIRTQCAIWLLALIAWMDGHGWRRFDPADARLLSLTHPSGVHLAAGRLERVDAHVLREAAGARPVDDRLAGDRAFRVVDRRRQPGSRPLAPDRRRSRADDA